MTPEGERLDRFLGETIGDLKQMPEIGSRSAVTSVKAARELIKRAAEEAALSLVQRSAEMADEIKANAQLVRQKMEGEHTETMAVLNEWLGNDHPGAVDDEPRQPPPLPEVQP